MLSEERLNEMDEAFDFIIASFKMQMNDFRRELVKKCIHCKIFQDRIVEADIDTDMGDIAMKEWTEHVQEVHFNV